jgi:F-type H+-transporting ATPase subunit b
MPQFDLSVYCSQVFWMCVSFGLLFWAIQAFLMPKIKQLQQKRADEKNAVLKEAQDLLDQAVALEQDIESRRKNARDDAAAVVSQALTLCRQRMQEELYAHQSSYQAQLIELEKTIEQERTVAWKTLYDSVPDLCDLLTKKWGNTGKIEVTPS